MMVLAVLQQKEWLMADQKITKNQIPENYGIVDNLISVRCDMSHGIDDDGEDGDDQR